MKFKSGIIMLALGIATGIASTKFYDYRQRVKAEQARRISSVPYWPPWRALDSVKHRYDSIHGIERDWAGQSVGVTSRVKLTGAPAEKIYEPPGWATATLPPEYYKDPGKWLRKESQRKSPTNADMDRYIKAYFLRWKSLEKPRGEESIYQNEYITAGSSNERMTEKQKDSILNLFSSEEGQKIEFTKPDTVYHE